MGFIEKLSEEKGTVIISETNKVYRKNLAEKYQIYQERVKKIAHFYQWDDKKLHNALNFKDFDSPKVDKRLQELEEKMYHIEQKDAEALSELQKNSPNSVVFKIIFKNNTEKTFVFNEGNASKLFNGLVMRTSSIEDSPFKSQAHVVEALSSTEESIKKLDNIMQNVSKTQTETKPSTKLKM